jgi:hypothetical protein
MPAGFQLLSTFGSLVQAEASLTLRPRGDRIVRRLRLWLLGIAHPTVPIDRSGHLHQLQTKTRAIYVTHVYRRDERNGVGLGIDIGLGVIVSTLNYTPHRLNTMPSGHETDEGALPLWKMPAGVQLVSTFGSLVQTEASLTLRLRDGR